MTPKQLQTVLDGPHGAVPYIVGQPGREASTPGEVYLLSWRAAVTEANAAYREWRGWRTPSRYAVYRACENRADAAQDAPTGGTAEALA
jgi:hypothetical protein